jgi:AmiR/NasT family two-component response regulator
MSELSTDLRAKILIAEDDAIVALDLQGMVMRLGYDVVSVADSGQAAVASMKRFQPDVVLLDMVLSGTLDGIEVAREIQKDFDVPIIFCISSPDLAVLSRAKEITYAGYLLKPINPDSLATTLDTALYKYKLEKRVRNAEEKFRQLSAKSEIFQRLIDGNSAWEWEQSVGGGLTLHSFPESLTGESVKQSLRNAADACRISEAGQCALCVEIDAAAPKKRMALLSILVRETDIVSGILIPLAGSD